MDYYTVKTIRVEDVNERLKEFFTNSSSALHKLHSHFPFKFGSEEITHYINRHRMTICYQGFKPVGLLMSRLFPSIWNPIVKILYQDLLYSETKRGTYCLLKDFIDFGRRNANSIVTTIGVKTDLNRRSLEKLGFSKTEESYEIEV